MTQIQDTAAAGEMLAAALTYTAQGLKVFPCRPGTKVPATAAGHKAATGDADQVDEWWRKQPDANIGIRTGAESGLVVLDVDAQHGGLRTLAELERRHGKLPTTARVLTGGGGYHYLFKHPGGEIRSSTGRLGSGLDIRADGGYIIAPPSVHESGRAYISVRGIEQGLADCPAWILEGVRCGRGESSAVEVLGIIPEGRRRAAMLTVAGKLKRVGLAGEEILPTLAKMNERCRPPLHAAELRSVAFKSTISVDPKRRSRRSKRQSPAHSVTSSVRSRTGCTCPTRGPSTRSSPRSPPTVRPGIPAGSCWSLRAAGVRRS